MLFQHHLIHSLQNCCCYQYFCPHFVGDTTEAQRHLTPNHTTGRELTLEVQWVKTLHFQLGGKGLSPVLGTKIPHVLAWPINK